MNYDTFIIRKAKQNGYTKIANTFLQDSSLSFEARGMGASLLSRPNDWEINVSALMTEGNIGREKVKKIIKELMDAGYMFMCQGRKSGKFAKNLFFISDEKDYLNEKTVENEQSSPSTRKPSAVSPSTVNREQQIKEYNKEIYITKKATTTELNNKNKIDSKNSSQKKVSSSSYDFLKNYKIDNATKLNIQRYIKNLTAEVFDKVYKKVLERYEKGKINDFSGALFSALKDNWYSKAEEQKNSDREEKRLKGLVAYYVDYYSNSACSEKELINKFNSEIKNLSNKSLIDSYREKLLKSIRKEE